MDRYRIVLADDHALIRQGLGRIIKGVANLEVVGEAGDGIELRRCGLPTRRTMRPGPAAQSMQTLLFSAIILRGPAQQRTGR
jgi:hypothetical protein